MRKSAKRYCLLDALRGFSLLGMIAYHFCYDLRVVFLLPLTFMDTAGAFWWQQSICWTFILCSGAAMQLGRNPAKRGALVLGCGMLLTVVTFAVMPSQRIVFGVLHLLGSAMLLTALTLPLLRRIPSLAGVVICAVLFAGTRWLSDGILFGATVFSPQEISTNLFAPLGVFGRGFYSSDYFPIVPWYFLFLVGYFLFGLLCERGWDYLLMPRVWGLSAIGKQTLPVYLLHQPVLLGLAWLVWRMF